MVPILSGIVAFLLIIIISLLHRNSALSRGFEECVAENKEHLSDLLYASKYEELSVALSQLRAGGLSDKKFFFETVLDCACAILGSGRGSMMVFDENIDELYIIAARNISRDLVEKVRIKPGEGIAGRVFQKGEQIYVSDPSANPQYSGYENRPEQKEPFLSLPVKTSRRTYAVLNLHINRRFTNFDINLLTLLSEEAGLLMENNRLKEALNPANIKKKKSAFVEAIDEADARAKEEEAYKRKRREAEEAAKARIAASQGHSAVQQTYSARENYYSGGFAAPAASHRGGFSSVRQRPVPVQPSAAAQIQPQAVPANSAVPQQETPAVQRQAVAAPPGMQFIQVGPDQYMAAPQMVYVPVQIPAQGGQPATQVFAQMPAGMAQGGVQYIRVMPEQFIQVPAAGMPPMSAIPQPPVSPPPAQAAAPVHEQPVQYVSHPMPNMPGTAAGIAAGNIVTENVEKATEHLMQRFSLNRSFAQPKRPDPKQNPPQKPRKPAQAKPAAPVKKDEDGQDVIIEGNGK